MYINRTGRFRSLPGFPWNLTIRKSHLQASHTRLLGERSLQAGGAVLPFLSVYVLLSHANAPTISRFPTPELSDHLDFLKIFHLQWIPGSPRDIQNLCGQLGNGVACAFRLPRGCLPRGCLPRTDWALESDLFSPVRPGHSSRDQSEWPQRQPTPTLCSLQHWQWFSPHFIIKEIKYIRQESGRSKRHDKKLCCFAFL